MQRKFAHDFDQELLFWTRPQALKAANAKYERNLYPGTHHGFHKDTTLRYDAAAAKLAWDRTLAFFNKHVRHQA